MRYNLYLVAMLLTFGLIMPAFSQDEKKDDKKPDVKKDDPAVKKVEDPKGKDDKKIPDKVEVKKFTYGMTFAGTLTSISDKTGELTVKVTQKLKVLHADAAKRKFDYDRDLANRLYNIQRQTNPFEKQRQIIEYQQRLAKPPELYYFKDVSQDVTLRIGKDMKVRTAIPEPQYDAKGNLIPPTPAKLKELQGPEGYPGFPVEITSLHTNALVQVYINLPANLKKDPKKPANSLDISDIIGGGAKKDPEKPEIEINPNLPETVAIVIIQAKK